MCYGDFQLWLYGAAEPASVAAKAYESGYTIMLDSGHIPTRCEHDEERHSGAACENSMLQIAETVDSVKQFIAAHVVHQDAPTAPSSILVTYDCLIKLVLAADLEMTFDPSLTDNKRLVL